MADENNNQQTTEEKVEFTDKQQEAINKLFDTRFGKIQSKHSKELETKQAEIDAAKLAEKEAREALEAAKGGKGENKNGEENKEEEAKQQYKELLDNEKNRTRLAEAAATKANDEAKKAREEALLVKKRQAMYNAMGGKNFYQPEDVISLTDKNVVFDSDSNDFVVKENGVIRQNSSLQNMTLDEYFLDFASKRPYLVNGDIKSGTGSRESSGAGTAGTVTKKSDLKSVKEKSDYIQKFGFDKFAELPK